MDYRKESTYLNTVRNMILALLVITILSCDQMPRSYDVGLEHQVYLALFSESDGEEVKKELMKLEAIEGVEAIEVWTPLDVGDKRAMDYDLLLRVYFKDEAALKAYDTDSLHQAVRARLKDYLRKPPATFDLRYPD